MSTDQIPAQATAFDQHAFGFAPASRSLASAKPPVLVRGSAELALGAPGRPRSEVVEQT